MMQTKTVFFLYREKSSGHYVGLWPNDIISDKGKLLVSQLCRKGEIYEKYIVLKYIFTDMNILPLATT